MKYRNFDSWFADFIALEKVAPHCNAYALRPLRVKYVASLLPELDTISKVKKIHVTGSSGKSSCAKIWGEFLFQQGFSVGVITKPHICNFNERYWHNGKLASEKDLLPLFEKIMEVNKTVSKHLEYGSLRYVEIMFLVGLLYFSKLKPDYLVVEAGIGALNDYTNIFSEWEIGIITSIHNEHRRRLGGSIDSIIDHKVDIINKSKFAYILEQSSNIQQKIREKILTNVNASWVHKDFDLSQSKDTKNDVIVRFGSNTISLKTNVISKMQLVNIVSVLHYVTSIKKITKSINYKFNILGKFDTRLINGKTLVFDTAHTPESVADVIDSLNIQYPNRDKYVFLAVTGKRKGREMIELIKSNVGKIYTVKLKIKGVPFKYYSDLGEQEIIFKEIEQEVNKLPKNAIVIFTGSVYYVGYAIKIFEYLI